MNSPTFVQQLVTQCHTKLGTVILPEAQDTRTMEAVNFLIEKKICSQIILLGDADVIQKNISKTCRHADEKVLCIRSSSDPTLKKNVREHFYKRQVEKGRSPNEEQLSNIEGNPLFQAGWLLTQDRNACVIAGAVATTAEVIRAALSTVGLGKGMQTVSGGFFMDRTVQTQRQSFYYADAGVVVDPTSEQLVDIAASSCETWTKIMGEQNKPVVAFLSFSTKGSAAHSSVDKVSRAAELFQARFPHIEADGELQFDAAIIESVGLRKAPKSKVPGRANIFVFPDLNSGNIAYKITQRLAGFDAYGPILQGLSQPYSDLSRGATASDIAMSAMINLCRT